MRLTATHALDVSPEGFFDDLFFDREFNERLYLEALEMKGFEILSLVAAGDVRSKRIRVTPRPRVEPPAVVRKVLAGELSYTEEGTWRRQDGVYRYRTRTSMAAERIRISGSVRALPAGAGRCERTIEVDIDVALPLVGGQLERFVGEQLRASFDRGALFANEWIGEKGL